MADVIDMLSFPAPGRSPGYRVAWRYGKPVDHGSFLMRMAAWRKLLRSTPGQSFALWLEDGVELAAALFGAWHERKTIYLPGDRLPATCAVLSGKVAGYLGEFSALEQPRVPATSDGLAPVLDPAYLDPNFIGLILYTSGSTGAARAVPKKLGQLAAELVALETQFGTRFGTADIAATVSHQHIYGLLFKILWPLCAGRPFHAGSFFHFEELQQVLSLRDHVLVSSPAHLTRLPEDPNWVAASKRIATVFSSGGPLPFEVAHEIEGRIGQLPYEVYGSSETGGVAWRRQRTADEGWMPLPGVQWRVDKIKGVLEVRAKHLPNEKWIRTADCATPLDGRRFLLGERVDRIAKIEGKRISLSAIEEGLKASPWVQDARALVLDGRRQRIAAIVVPTPAGRRQLARLGKLGLGRALRQQLSLSVDPLGRPRVWRYIDAVPINAQGKTTHAELMALLGNPQCRLMQPIERGVLCDSQRAVVELLAPRDLICFDGHFRQRPILAGVVQVDWVIAYGRRCFDLPPCFRGIRALKFQRVIPPEVPFALELLHEPARSSLRFKISSRLGDHASGRILFGAVDV